MVYSSQYAVIPERAYGVVRLEQSEVEVAPRDAVEQTAEKGGVETDIDFLILEKIETLQIKLVFELIGPKTA